jgi:hypothetical protein
MRRFFKGLATLIKAEMILYLVFGVMALMVYVLGRVF